MLKLISSIIIVLRQGWLTINEIKTVGNQTYLYDSGQY